MGKITSLITAQLRKRGRYNFNRHLKSRRLTVWTDGITPCAKGMILHGAWIIQVWQAREHKVIETGSTALATCLERKPTVQSPFCKGNWNPGHNLAIVPHSPGTVSVLLPRKVCFYSPSCEMQLLVFFSQGYMQNFMATEQNYRMRKGNLRAKLWSSTHTRADARIPRLTTRMIYPCSMECPTYGKYSVEQSTRGYSY